MALLLVLLGALAIPAYSLGKAILTALEHGDVAYAWLASEANKGTNVNRAKVLEDLIQAELAKRQQAVPAQK